jgi:dihydrofolate reductase
VDEYRLMIFPVVLGSGKRLFREGSDRRALELVDSRAFETGVLYLTYRPKGEQGAGRGSRKLGRKDTRAAS